MRILIPFFKPEVSLTGWIIICNFSKWNVHLILNAPFQARTLLLFYKFGWLTINKITIERFLILFPKILDQRAPDYLSELQLSMKYCIVSIWYKISICLILPVPRTNSKKWMFFFNALQLWKNISDNDFVYSMHWSQEI